ncbi:hypothetical protein SDC9_118815 [bioreactor metagenome]|uniref:Uncharacterized protein n=1 Tax=bioreactor metagenome TaxID=1076179 RepID=A0A645C951_9ZZZZ
MISRHERLLKILNVARRQTASMVSINGTPQAMIGTSKAKNDIPLLVVANPMLASM